MSKDSYSHHGFKYSVLMFHTQKMWLILNEQLNNMHIIRNNVGLVFNIKYQSLFNTWGYKCSDVGDFANSSGKPRSCWDHRYTFCTSWNLTASRLNCEARFSVQVTTMQHAIQEQLTFALQHITTQLNICSKLWKLGLHTHYMKHCKFYAFLWNTIVGHLN
jgi:hypothetical protein